MDFCSIVDNTQINRFQTAADSLTKNSTKTISFHLLVVDSSISDLKNCVPKGYKIYSPEDFFDQTELIELYTKYNLSQICIILKPLFITYLLKKKGFEKMVYISPDLFFLGTPSEFFNSLESFDVLVIPHFLSTGEHNQVSEWTHDIKTRGIFDLGLIGFKNTSESLDFLNWWSQQVFYSQDPSAATEYLWEQKCIGQAIIEFSGIGIFKNPGYNVAHWNLQERPLRTKNKKIYVGDFQLKCFHFNDVNFNQDLSLTRFKAILLDENKILKELFIKYCTKVDYFRKVSAIKQTSSKFIELF